MLKQLFGVDQSELVLSLYSTCSLCPHLGGILLGYVCIEAVWASFGVPVIVAKSGALPEIIEHEKTDLAFRAWEFSKRLLPAFAAFPVIGAG